MNIKEQELREQLLKEISADRVVIIDALTGDNRTGYIAPVNALMLAEKIHTIYQSNSYYQLQADSDRVVSKAVSEALSANNAKWREKINKIPDNIYSRLKCGHSPMIVLATVRADIETLLSQMEGE